MTSAKMAASIKPSTPPPESSINTPSTPRYGAANDDYKPYSTRSSARFSQRSSNEEPSSAQSLHSLRSASGPGEVAPTSASASPSSPQIAPKKPSPKTSSIVGGRKVSGALDYKGAASAATSLGLPAPKDQGKTNSLRATAVIPQNGMLPTPDKTPQKRPEEHNKLAIAAIARNLFPVPSATDEEVMPSPKKRTKKHTGFTLASFAAMEDAPIQIYTDSHERIPEVDPNPENPFYNQGSAAVPEPTKRVSKRRKTVSVPGEGVQAIEDLQDREDGMVYTFRGKQVFRKFEDMDAPDYYNEDGINEAELNEAELDEVLPSSLRGPVTRSTVKPRILFPNEEQKEMRSRKTENRELKTKNREPKTEDGELKTEDEEADTDIEDSMDLSAAKGKIDDNATTSTALGFASASSPITTRVARSKHVDLSSSPDALTSDVEHLRTPPKHNARRTANVSPTAELKRFRSVKAKVNKKKREGEPITRGGGDKKLRG